MSEAEIVIKRIIAIALISIGVLILASFTMLRMSTVQNHSAPSSPEIESKA